MNQRQHPTPRFETLSKHECLVDLASYVVHTEMIMPCLQVQGQADKGTSLFMGGGSPNGGSNNYSRPSGQNVGNFLTERNSSRVLAPPGGASQISFG